MLKRTQRDARNARSLTVPDGGFDLNMKPESSTVLGAQIVRATWSPIQSGFNTTTGISRSVLDWYSV
jgi:hypothetical protein